MLTRARLIASRAAVRQPSRVVISRGFATDWNAMTRYFSQDPDETSRANSLRMIEECEKIISQASTALSSAPSTVTPVDFNAWKKRIFNRALVDLVAQKHSAVKIPPLQTYANEIAEAYTKKARESLTAEWQEYEPQLRQALLKLDADIKRAQQEKVDLEYLTWNDYLAANPDIEKELREKTHDGLRGLDA